MDTGEFIDSLTIPRVVFFSEIRQTSCWMMIDEREDRMSFVTGQTGARSKKKG